MKKFTLIICAALFAGPALATGDHGNNNGPKSSGNSTSNAASISGSMSSSKSKSRSAARSKSNSAAEATGGNALASGGSGGAGGQGGNASNGGQNVILGGTDMGKLAPDVSPPSMPSVTPCTTGMSGGVSIGGVGVSGGGYSYDDLCGWERQHAVAVATNDQTAAADIKHGMTMLRCQRMSPDDRKFFKACDALPKEQGKKASNSAFNSD